MYRDRFREPFIDIAMSEQTQRESRRILSDTLGFSLECRLLRHPTIQESRVRNHGSAPRLSLVKSSSVHRASPIASSIFPLSHHVISRLTQRGTVSMYQKHAQASALFVPNYCRLKASAFKFRQVRSMRNMGPKQCQHIVSEPTKHWRRERRTTLSY